MRFPIVLSGAPIGSGGASKNSSSRFFPYIVSNSQTGLCAGEPSCFAFVHKSCQKISHAKYFFTARKGTEPDLIIGHGAGLSLHSFAWIDFTTDFMYT
jgi:hypothetical protein